tara:strand:+ start:6374 stop:7204 length:831 start_codon:yes stop_codon:yes gene_type:complete
MSNDKDLLNFFKQSKYYSLKYKNYFPIYEKLFAKFRGKKITFVEIGVLSGGSLFMWKNYFGNDAKIIGIELNPEAKKFEREGFEIFIGNQADENFWKDFFEKVGKVDIILDDGGHTNFQQIVTCCSCIPFIKDNGLMVVEDVFHSYGLSYGAKGFFNPSKYSFINFCKKSIDDINFRFPDSKKFQFSLNKFIYSVEFYESIVAFNINKNLCNSKNEVIFSNGKNLEYKDYAHLHNKDIPGSNKFVLKVKKILKSFRGNLKYFVFKINEHISKKYFK